MIVKIKYKTCQNETYQDFTHIVKFAPVVDLKKNENQTNHTMYLQFYLRITFLQH